MGLAALYQIRGRVGRSDRQAYAYITYRRDKMLSEEADKRLKAIKEFTEFGSGFKIAMRDLEIRGAGSLLGEIQSGHLEQVGYDTYCTLLDEVVKEMKGEEIEQNIDIQIDLNVTSYIPDEYISDSSQKIEIYQNIALCKNEENIQNVVDEIIDRYGNMPEELENLLDIARIKYLAKPHYITKIASKKTKENQFIKHIKKLKDKKYRYINNEYLIEGIKLIKEAIQEKAQIKQIVICDECEKIEAIPKDLMYEIAKHECIYVTKKLFETLTNVVEPQGILAIIGKSDPKQEINYNEDIIVALDDIQDPGNLGTILRTVDSIGLTQIIISKGTADVYNPKVIRSSMGAIFRVKVIESENLEQTLLEIKKHKFELLVTSLQTKKSVYDIKYKKKIIVIGNEANGVSKEIQELSDYKIKIPMLGKTESLNASVATGIILYEYVRQKLLK